MGDHHRAGRTRDRPENSAEHAWHVALVAVLLETTVWRWLTALGRLFARLPFFAWLERLIERLSPGWVVAVFVVPFIPLVPLIKIGELWLIRNHHFVWAAVVIVGAKVVGVAFSTRVFAVAKPKMLQVRWFAAAYGWVTGLIDLGHRWLDGVPAYVTAREAVRRGKERLHVAGVAALTSLRARFAGEGRLGRRFWAARRRWRGG